MVAVYLLVCLLPVMFIVIVFFAIGAAGARTYRAAKRAYRDVLPYANDLKEKGMRAQRLSQGFGERANNIANTFNEIGGRWAFIIDTFQEASSSPLTRLAGMAGRLVGGDIED